MSYSQSLQQSKTLTSADQSVRPWYADWGNLAVLALVPYIVLFLLWMIFEWGGPGTADTVRELGFPPVMLLGVILAWRMARVSSVPKRTRQAWAVIGGAFLLWGVADSIWAYYHLTGMSVPSVSLFDPAYLGSSVALAIGVLMFPAARLIGRDRTRFWIDCGIIMTGLAALTAYIIVDPGNLQSLTSTLGALVLMLYPLSHMVVLIAVFSILVRRPEAGSVGVLMLLGAGLVIYAGTDFWWTYLEFRELYVPETVTYTTWIVAQALLVASPQWHYDVIDRNRPTSEPGRVAERVRVLIPYSAAAIGILIISYTALPEMLNRFGIAVVFLTALVTLIVARQVVTIRENGELRLRQAVRRTEERFRALVENSTDMITVLDTDLRCTFQSPASEEVIQRSPDEFMGTSLVDWVHEEDRDSMLEALQWVINTGSGREIVEWRMQLPDGRIINLESIVSSELENPAVSGIVLNSRDVTERKSLEARLTHQAYHDPLTGLPNRAMFFDMLRQVLPINPTETRVVPALLFVDVDEFKQVNDTFGHESGDEVLRQIANRLQTVVRGDDVLSRLAGDEFTILLNRVNSTDDAMAAAHRVLESLETPIRIDDAVLTVSPSVGVAVADSSIASPTELLRRADLAMYAAKRRGPGRAAGYEAWMEDSHNLSEARQSSRSGR